MLIIKQDMWSSVVAEDPDFMERLKERLTIRPERYSKTSEDACFYKEIKKGFWLDVPTGIVESMILPYFYFETVIDQRSDGFEKFDPNIVHKAFQEMTEFSPGFEVRPHQVAAAIKCMMIKRGICEAPTGFGKTEVISALCKMISGKILIINNRKSILHQIKQRMNDRGVMKKIEYLSEKVDLEGSEIIISTNNLIYNRIKKRDNKYLNYLKSLSAIIIDESHHASAISQITPILISNPEYLIGFTASKYKGNRCLDDCIIDAVLGRSIFSMTSRYLRDAGYLSKIYAYYIPYVGKTPKRFYRCEADVYTDMIVNNFQRNEKVTEITKTLLENNLKTIIFVSRIDHGKAIIEDLKSKGIKSLFYCGGDKIYEATDNLDNKYKHIIEERKGSVDEIKDCLKNNGYNVIVGNVVFNEGLDVPEFDAGILVDAGKNVISHIQRIGRVCRQKQVGINAAVFIDFDDNSTETLYNWTRIRIQHLFEEGISVVNKPTFYELIKQIGKSRNV